MKRFTTDSSAWEWIAQELSKSPRDSVIQAEPTYPDPCGGLCLVLMWMARRGMISDTRMTNMIGRLYLRFAPQGSLGERGDDPFFWERGVREPRVVAAQLMAILPVPRRGGK